MSYNDYTGIRDTVYDEVPDSIVKQFTPSPKKQMTMDFPDAMREVIAGKKVTKLEWVEKSESETYGLLKDGYLQIFRNGTFHNWIVSDGDLAGEDYVVK